MRIKEIDLSKDMVSEHLSYDPETGIFRWKKTGCRRIKPGSVAGSLKSIRVTTGEVKKYRYLTLNGVSSPAARFAWLLSYGEWPNATVHCKDGDTDNLRLANLELSKFPARIEMQGKRRVYKMSLEAQRHYGRKRYYGLTGEEYGAMLAEQKGVCAICGKPETAMLRGTPKQLHVDHCHTTNRIRSLLCGACNAMLGLAKDNVETLRAAADYLERHKTFPSLRLVTGSRKKDDE